jgi:hypothetical protein
MKVDAVDFFYLAMPKVTTDADGSQDALLVRAQVGPHVGWGECEASPLTCIASFVCPMSHGACRPVSESVLGQPLNDVADIARIRAAVQFNSMDLLQAAHTFSGIEIALWDALGKMLAEPVYRLLGYKAGAPKLAYASQLFGETPAETETKAKSARQAGFRAVKFGWVNYGRGTVAEDAAHVEAARAGMGPDAQVLIDAGQIFAQDVRAAAERIPALARFGVLAGGALPPGRLGGLWRARRAEPAGAHRWRRGLSLVPHGFQPDRFREDRLRPDRHRAHRRHRSGKGSGGSRGRQGGDLRQPHVHVASRSVGLSAALRRPRESSDCGISLRTTVAGARYDRESHHTR